MRNCREVSSSLAVCALLLQFAHGVPAEAAMDRQEKLQIRFQVEQSLAMLDETVASISDLEYVRWVFWSFKGGPPTQSEADNVVGFLVGDVENHIDRNGRVHQCRVQLKRSDVFLRFLKDEIGIKEHFEYDWLKSNFRAAFDKFYPFRSLPEDAPLYSQEEKEETVTLQSYAPMERLNNKKYDNYFGNIHGHTNFSDGKGTPQEAYLQTRDEYQLDYFATSEHALMLSLLPWDDKWSDSRDIADFFNSDGHFVTLYVFEWSSFLFGHINVFGTEDMTTSFITDTPFPVQLYAWLEDRPEAIARFNHPVRKACCTFEHFEHDRPNGKRNVVGIEVFNKDKNIAMHLNHTGFDPMTPSNHFEEGLDAGWELGIAGGQDDHDKNWGALKHAVTGVWTTALTRDAIYDAYLNRRTYATEDRNLSLSFKIDGNEMGSRLPVPMAGNAEAVIRVIDPDGVSRKIQLYKNGEMVKEAPPPAVDPHDVTVTWSIMPTEGDYYYVVVIDTVPEYAVSSPIWFQ